MKWTRDISLRNKLITGFLTINILLFIIGVVGTLAMRRIDNTSNLMYDEYLQSIDDLHQIRENLLESDIILQYVKQANEPGPIDSMFDAISELVEGTSDVITRYEARDMDDIEKEPWGMLKENLAEFRVTRDKAVQSMKDNNGSDSRKAIDGLTQHSQPVYDGIEHMIEMNQG